MIYIVDTETTGIDEPQCIEFAYMLVTPDQHVLLSDGATHCERFLPAKPTSYGAMATHHIQLNALSDCRPHTEAKVPADCTYLIGHNIDYDWKVLGSPDVKRICTLAMARRMWADMDSHKLGALIYRLWPATATELLRNAHSAAADVHLCHMVINHMLAMLRPDGIEALWAFSEKARIPTVMTFGKHKGQAIADVPADYNRWLKGQPDVDPYLLKALQ